MRRVPFYLSLLLLITCAKEDSQAPNTPPSNITPKYTLFASAGEGGSVSPTTESFNAGTLVSVTATPSAGYQFTSWSNGSTANPVTVRLNTNVFITANFEVLINSYTITAIAGEGGSVSSQGGEYEEGTELTISATPDVGYRFVNWSNGSSEPDITFTVNENINLEAIFEELPKYEIVFSEPNGGIIVVTYTYPNGNVENANNDYLSGEYYEGEIFTITPYSQPGYRFVGWVGIDSTDNPLELIVESNIEISAEFEVIPFDVNDMDNVKYHLYNKDTLNGKKVNNIKSSNYYNANFNNLELENIFDYLASENFIVYWDIEYNHTNYAIDILRWAEFSVVKALEMGMFKPKDFDTHRITIFITRAPEYGNSVIGATCQCARSINNRRSINIPFNNNYNESDSFKNYPTMDVPHEVFHLFQKGNDGAFSSESTPTYFQSKYIGEKRPSNFWSISEYLGNATNLKLWSGGGFSGFYEAYGRSILWHYLDWNGYIDNNFIARMYNQEEYNLEGLVYPDHVKYMVREIDNFRDKYFDFSMKSVVVDFPQWRDIILNDLESKSLKRHELILYSDNNHLTKNDDEYDYNNKLYTPSIDNDPWGFTSYKIFSGSNENYKIELNTNYENYRIGIIKENDGIYQYSEINSGDIISSGENEAIYVVVVDIPISDGQVDSFSYNFDSNSPSTNFNKYKIKISIQ